MVASWWHHGGYEIASSIRRPWPPWPLAGLDRQEEYGHCAVVNFVDPGFVIDSQKLSEIFLQILQITKQMSLPFSDFCVACRGHILFLRMMCQQLFQQAGEAWVIWVHFCCMRKFSVSGQIHLWLRNIEKIFDLSELRCVICTA
jgi:hypothetical protein